MSYICIFFGVSLLFTCKYTLKNSVYYCDKCGRCGTINVFIIFVLIECLIIKKYAKNFICPKRPPLKNGLAETS